MYILENARGSFYVGQTEDLARRLSQHNSADRIATKYNHKNGPWEFVRSEEHETRSEAMIRERQIKAMKSARWIRENLLSR